MTIWIDPKTQVFKIDFNPQELSPAQYGVVIASIIIHLSKMFGDSNPDVPVEQITRQIRAGIDAGLEQIKDMPLPSRSH